MNGTELVVAVKNAKAIFKELKAKYGGLAGYLVFALPPGSAPWGQCEMKTGLITFLEEKNDKYDQKALRDMIIDSVHKQAVIDLLRRIADFEKGRKNSYSTETKSNGDRGVEKLRKALSLNLEILEMRDDVLIEIRFDHLDYDLIFKMQKDPLVSQQLTPQTRASIRIVLGTVQEIGQRVISRDD